MQEQFGKHVILTKRAMADIRETANKHIVNVPAEQIQDADLNSIKNNFNTNDDTIPMAKFAVDLTIADFMKLGENPTTEDLNKMRGQIVQDSSLFHSNEEMVNAYINAMAHIPNITDVTRGFITDAIRERPSVASEISPVQATPVAPEIPTVQATPNVLETPSP